MPNKNEKSGNLIQDKKVYDISDDSYSDTGSNTSSNSDDCFDTFNCTSNSDSESESESDLNSESEYESESDSESESEIESSQNNSFDTSTSSDTKNDNSTTSNSDELLIVKKKPIKTGKCNKISKTVKKYNIFSKRVLKSNDIFKELVKKQLKNIPSQWKLNINDMKRICKYIDTSIFDPYECCIWKGYITNANNSNKGTYVNFYFKNKKVALHRLLYSNFVAPLDSSEYLKFNCDNKGVCCNVNHYEKYKYSKGGGGGGLLKREKTNNEKKKETKEIIIIGSDESDKLIIDFD